jgi:uncharacterized protein (DUF1697 family)
MQTYISFLRGINMAGHKIIKMEDLRQVFTDSGFKNVRTYIQSGNVIFQAEKTNPKDLAKKIEKIILEKYSFEVPVIVIEPGELKIILQNNPFLKDKLKDLTYAHITFLSDEPASENIDKIRKAQYLPDEFELTGKIIYVNCPNGYGKTKLSNSFFESKLKVSATSRNLKTSNELLVIAEKLNLSIDQTQI